MYDSLTPFVIVAGWILFGLLIVRFCMIYIPETISNIKMEPWMFQLLGILLGPFAFMMFCM